MPEVPLFDIAHYNINILKPIFKKMHIYFDDKNLNLKIYEYYCIKTQTRTGLTVCILALLIYLLINNIYKLKSKGKATKFFKFIKNF